MELVHHMINHLKFIEYTSWENEARVLAAQGTITVLLDRVVSLAV